MVELMLAMSITAVMGVALTAMLSAISAGMDARHDTRTHLLQANAAQIRLAAYIKPSLAILDSDGSDVVLWFDDSRRSGTVHATEIRWLLYNEDEGTIIMFRVQFPSDWTLNQKLVADREYAPSTDWMAVYREFRQNEWITGFVLVDGLDDVAVSFDQALPRDSRHVTYRFVARDSNVHSLVSASLQVPREPA